MLKRILTRYATTVFLIALVSGISLAGRVDASANVKKQPHVEKGKVQVQSGLAVPDFTLPDLNGKLRSLSDYRGKVVMLNFWATWCIPCVAEMPLMNHLHQELKDEGLVILAVSIDERENLPAVTRFVAQNKLNFVVLHDADKQLTKTFGVSGFPETFFIGRDGKFVAFPDPETKKPLVRIVRDRPWHEPSYQNACRKLL